jgi:hypothetical protein
MEPVVLLDAAGRRRSAATMPGHRRGQSAAQQGHALPRRSAERGGDRAGHACRRRSRAWSAVAGADRGDVARGLRIGEALALTDSNHEARGAILVRHGKDNKCREVGMDQ